MVLKRLVTTAWPKKTRGMFSCVDPFFSLGNAGGPGGADEIEYDFEIEVTCIRLALSKHVSAQFSPVPRSSTRAVLPIARTARSLHCVDPTCRRYSRSYKCALAGRLVSPIWLLSPGNRGAVFQNCHRYTPVRARKHRNRRCLDPCPRLLYRPCQIHSPPMMCTSMSRRERKLPPRSRVNSSALKPGRDLQNSVRGPAVVLVERPNVVDRHNGRRRVLPLA